MPILELRAPIISHKQQREFSRKRSKCHREALLLHAPGTDNSRWSSRPCFRQSYAVQCGMPVCHDLSQSKVSTSVQECGDTVRTITLLEMIT